MVVKTSYRPKSYHIRETPGRIQPYALWDGVDLLKFFEDRDEAEREMSYLERRYSGFTSGDLKIG